MPPRRRKDSRWKIPISIRDMQIPDLSNIEPARLSELMARSRDLRADYQDDLVPADIDGYQIIAKLGEGASGTVWRARQLATGREVALKLLHGAALGSFKARQRFEREIELTARLAHPGIARLYDSGTRRGIWFHAMELIDGLPLDRYATANKLPIRGTLQLMAQVCRAVQHAHEHGIIHRDLKPSNILVTQDGQPHVLDFGLARATQTARAGLSITVDGEVTGTFGFMPPEQAAGESDGVDTRGDVYSLGAILYLLLTGRPPHDSSEKGLMLARQVAEQDPPRPRAVNPRINGEIEALLLKAMAHDPATRYASAGELAEDIDRYLRGDPLVARAPTLAYFVRRRVQRNKLPIAIATGACAALLAMLVYTYARVTRERNVAIQESIRADRQNAIARGALRLAEERLADGLLAQAAAMAEAQRWLEAKAFYEEAWTKLESQGRSVFPAKAGLLKAYQFAPPPLNEFEGATGPVAATAISPDGRLVAGGGRDGTLWIWETATGRLIRTWHTHGGALHALAFSPSGDRLLSGDSNGYLAALDVSTGRKLWSYHQGGQVLQVAWSPDGRKVGAASYGGGQVVLHASSGRLISRPLGEADVSHCVAFSADSSMCAFGNALVLWIISDGDLKASSWPIGHNVPWAVCFSPDGNALVSGSQRAPASSDKAQLWDWASHRLIRNFPISDTVDRVGFSADSKLVYGAGDGIVRVWNRSTGEPVRTIWSDGGPVLNMALLPSRDVAVSSSNEHGPRLWDLAGGASAPSARFDRPLNSLATSPDDRHLFVGGNQISSALGEDLKNPLPFSNPDAIAQCAAFSPDGQFALIGWSTGEIWLQKMSEPQNHILLGKHDSDPRTILISKDGSQALTANGNSAFIWNLRNMTKTSEARADATLARGGAFVDQDRRAMEITVHGRIAVFQLDSGAGSDGAQLDVPRDLTSNAVFLHNGRQVAAACGSSAFLFEAATGRRLAAFAGHRDDIVTLSVSPDGKWLASGGWDNTCRLWELATGRQIQTFDVGTAPRAVAWSRDGRRLYCAAVDGSLRCFDFSLPNQYRQFRARMAQARTILQKAPDNQAARRNLADWYSYRHREDWAAEVTQPGPLDRVRTEAPAAAHFVN